MAEYKSALALLLELGRRDVRETVDLLFRFREMSFDKLQQEIGDPQFIRRLIARGILTEGNDDRLYLDERIQAFLEEFLEVKEEILNFEIDERIHSIQRKINLYYKETDIAERETYVDKIKKDIRRIGKVVRKNVLDLNRLVLQDYKTAGNPQVKRLKILDHNQKADRLKQLIDAISDLLDDSFFQMVKDEYLMMLIVQLRHDYLLPARFDLLHLSQEIIRYVNRIAQAEQTFEQLMKLKKLRDLHELEVRTNIREVVSAQQAMVFDTAERFSTKPSLSFLQSDDGYDLIRRVALQRQHVSRQMQRAAQAIDASLLMPQMAMEQRINYAALKEKFLRSDKDLASFVMEYDFQLPTSFEERTKVYCKLALMYEREYHFTEEMVRHQAYEFALIYPKHASGLSQ